MQDEQGRPVAGAKVTVEPRRQLWQGVLADKRGSFYLPRHAGDSSQPVRLQVRKDGYEDFDSKKRYLIDSQGIRVVMKVGTGLTIRVTRADTKRPVEDYGVWLLQQTWSKGLEDYRPRFA